MSTFVPITFNGQTPNPSEVMPPSFALVNENFWSYSVSINIDANGVHLSDGAECTLYGPSLKMPVSEECKKTPVYASAFGFITNGDRFLVVQKKRGAMWFPPGGMLESGEDLADACRREIKEETGVQVEKLSPQFAYESMMPRNGEIVRHNLMVFFCGSSSQEELVVNDEDIVDAKWVTSEEFTAMSTTDGMRFCIQQWL